MALLTSTRAVTEIHVAEFAFNFNDTMVDIAGVTKDFGASSLAMAFDVINLPTNSVVVGGGLTIRTAFDTAGYDVIIGDSGSTNRYFATADVKGLGHTALVPTGYKNTSGLKIRMTIASDDVCTTGVGLLRVQYVIEGSAGRVQPY